MKSTSGRKLAVLLIIAVLPTLLIWALIPTDRLGYLMSNPLVTVISLFFTIIGAYFSINEARKSSPDTQETTTQTAKNFIAKEKSFAIQKVENFTFQQEVDEMEVRQIARKEFDDNMPRLEDAAKKIAAERAEDLVKNFLLAIPENDQKIIASFKEPDMHLTLLEAQIGYARSGDANLEQVLIDLLVKRALEEQNSEKSMILSESIKVVPKLTTTHLDSLTIILLLTRTKLSDLMEPHDLATQLENILVPFLKNISLDASSYEYLNYTGCGSIMRVARWPPMHEIFRAQFPQIFKEKSPDEIRDQVLLLCDPLTILFDEWSTRTISRFDFNAVGVAIAQANFRKRTDKALKDSLPLVNAKVSD